MGMKFNSIYRLRHHHNHDFATIILTKLHISLRLETNVKGSYFRVADEEMVAHLVLIFFARYQTIRTQYLHFSGPQ